MSRASEPGRPRPSSAPSHAALHDAREAAATEPPATRARRIADGVLQARCAPPLSLDRLRGAVMRYAEQARELALAPEEMLAGLVPAVRRCVGRVTPERATEVQALVQWWALHAYHRAD
jgi:hypothetical protein